MERVSLDIVCDRCGSVRRFVRESESHAALPDAGLIRGAGWRHLTYRDYAHSIHHSQSETMTVCPRCIEIVRGDREAGIEMDTGPPHINVELEPVAGSDETVAGPIQTVAENLANRSAWDDYPIPRHAMHDVWRATGRPLDVLAQIADNNTPADTWAEVCAQILELRNQFFILRDRLRLHEGPDSFRGEVGE